MFLEELAGSWSTLGDRRSLGRGRSRLGRGRGTDIHADFAKGLALGGRGRGLGWGGPVAGGLDGVFLFFGRRVNRGGRGFKLDALALALST